MKLVLGIETSCDETACAIVRDDGKILGHVVQSQIKDHKAFGGVVPEIAARAHLDLLAPCLEACLEQAGVPLKNMSAIAATTGPGLIGGVMVGATFAKGIAFGLGKPFIAINHLEAHALTVRLTHDVPFPFVLLLVSGGHCQIILAKRVGDYQILGSTIDDAVGEAFDKTAKLLGLGYPGGPAIEMKAKKGDPLAYSLPRPLVGKKACDFSFSGLKTAARLIIEKQLELTEEFVCDLSASFQKTVGDSLVQKLTFALESMLSKEMPGHLVVAGGVASNQYLRERLERLAGEYGVIFAAADRSLCTDNGAMVAWAGVEYLNKGLASPLDTPSKPRWPLDTLSIDSMVRL
ncbi:MAG: tRNA (adenosine(37)-N6)-threonylcarbamoyltransferase complex transferase subunit TsaD [Alphaproteobacteria bacterium]|nr:tRNA (adenosine(37)-N6)-threonylcarbamoyltransferase complex transferase subunit TsaD [Alphaproteobacteria bacterium]